MSICGNNYQTNVTRYIVCKFITVRIRIIGEGTICSLSVQTSTGGGGGPGPDTGVPPLRTA